MALCMYSMYVYKVLSLLWQCYQRGGTQTIQTDRKYNIICINIAFGSKTFWASILYINKHMNRMKKGFPFNLTMYRMFTLFVLWCSYERCNTTRITYQHARTHARMHTHMCVFILSHIYAFWHILYREIRMSIFQLSVLKLTEHVGK